MLRGPVWQLFEDVVEREFIAKGAFWCTSNVKGRKLLRHEGVGRARTPGGRQEARGRQQGRPTSSRRMCVTIWTDEGKSDAESILSSPSQGTHGSSRTDKTTSSGRPKALRAALGEWRVRVLLALLMHPGPWMSPSQESLPIPQGYRTL